jgi:hypothetical protein
MANPHPPLYPKLIDAFLGDLAAAWTCYRTLHLWTPPV